MTKQVTTGEDEARDTRVGCLVLTVAVLLPPLLVGLTIGCPAAACGATLWLTSAVNRNLTGEQGWLVGVVEEGEFLPMLGRGLRGNTCRLTRMAMQVAQSPESEEIDLLPFEGSVILIRGRDGGGWIYSAEVIAEGGAMLNALVRLCLRPAGGATLTPSD